MTDIEIQAIAHVSPGDVACAIAGLKTHEINNIFMEIAERLDEPEDIQALANNLLKNCQLRFGR